MQEEKDQTRFEHMVTYMAWQVERVQSDSGTPDDVTGETADKAPPFSAVTFFQTLEGYRIDQNEPVPVLTIADQLDFYMPKLFKALSYRGCEFDKVAAYREWLNFLGTHSIDQIRLVRTATKYGNAIIDEAQKMNHQHAAFNALIGYTGSIASYVIHTLHDMPDDSKEGVSNLILRHAPEILHNAIAMKPDGLGEWVEPEKGDGYYYSYCTNARIVHSNCIVLLGETAEENKVDEFIENVYPQLYTNILERQAGTIIFNENLEMEDIRYADSENAFKSYDAGLMYFYQKSKMKRTAEYAFTHGSELMRDLLKKAGEEAQNPYDVTLKWHYQAYKATMAVLGGTDYGRRFAVTAGARDTLALMKKGYGHEAADMLKRSRDRLCSDPGEALVLCDPESDKPMQPLAIVFPQSDQTTEIIKQKEREPVALIFEQQEKIKHSPQTALDGRIADIVTRDYVQISVFQNKGDMVLDEIQQNAIENQAAMIEHNMRMGQWQDNALKLGKAGIFYSVPVRYLLNKPTKP